jgi:GYD domain
MQGGVDFAAVRASAQRDLLDQRLDHFRRLITTLRFIERFRPPLDLFSDRCETRSDGCPEYPTIVEAPDESSAMSLSLSLGALGNVRTETLRAFSAAEMTNIVGKML